MASRFVFNAKRFERLVNDQVDEVIEIYADEWVRIAQGMLSTRFPPPSKEGEPPRRRTGQLQAHVGHSRNFKEPGVRRIGVRRPRGFIARFLELGTRKMRPRPFIRPAVMKLAGGRPVGIAGLRPF